MGMFDSVYVKCPYCNSPNELQSKADECILNVYYASEGVPFNIAKALHENICFCYECDKEFFITANIPYVTYTLNVIKAEDYRK